MKNKLKKDLSWEIEVLPVQIKGQTTVLNKALVRSDDQKLIGIRSRYYKPVFQSRPRSHKGKNTPGPEDFVSKVTRNSREENASSPSLRIKRNIHCVVNALPTISLSATATMDRVSCSLAPQTTCIVVKTCSHRK